jgi:DNA-binding CsgD family transcriptional regulator
MTGKRMALFGFIVTPMLFSRMFTAFYPEAAYFDFRIVFDMSALVLWAVLAVLGSGSRRRMGVYYWTSAALLVVGSVLQIAVILLAVDPGYAVALSSCCFGAGYAIYCCLWISVYERERPAVSLVSIAISFAVGSAISNLPIVLVPNTPMGAIVSFSIHMTAIILSLLLLSESLRRAEGDEPAPRIMRAEDRQAGSSCRALVITSFISSFVIGLMVVDPSDYTSYGSVIIVAALMGFAAIIFILLRKIESEPHYFFVYYISSLLIATVLLLLGVSIAGGINGFLWMVSFAAAPLFDIVLFSMIASLKVRFGISPWRWLCVVYCLNEAGYLIGSALENTMAVNAGTLVCIAVLLVYLVYLIVVAIRRFMETVVSERRPGERPYLEEAAKRYGLTPREQEVLSYLLQGRSYESIGRLLCIAPSTVKTHVSHIYAKCDITTRDELLDLIDAPL